MTGRQIEKQIPRNAFTLMEMMVVVAIIVMLAGLSAWGYMKYLEGAKENKAKMDIAHLTQAVEAYKIEVGDYPETLQLLTQPIEGKPAPLETKDLNDPWSQPYVYESQNKNPATFRPRISSTHAMANGTQISNW